MIYMPPEYMSSSEISFKLDAYSYGVVRKIVTKYT